MDFDEQLTVEEKIRLLAEETGAPSVFVEQVRSLFQTKNIDLMDDCRPYLTALEEAFRREAAIRRDTVIARKNLARLQENFDLIGAKYKSQLARLKSAREALKRGTGGPARRSSDTRSFITRKQSDSLKMVPGPKEIQ